MTIQRRGVTWTHLLSVKQFGMLGNQCLELSLSREGLLLKRLKPSPLTSGVYAFAQITTPVRLKT